jgi:hypothetical protein
MGFALVAGFTGILQLATTSNSNISWMYTSYSLLWQALNLLSLLCLHYYSGVGFQQRTFCFFWIPELCPCLRYINCSRQIILSQEDLI